MFCAEATIGHMVDWVHSLPTVEDVLGGALPPAVWLIVYALAVTRLAGLVALDVIFDRPRLAVGEAAARHRATAWVDTLITCMWCVGIWVAAATVVAAMAITQWSIGPLFDWVLVGLALAQAAGMLSDIGRK